MTALADRVATPVDRADFDDLVTLVTQAPPWEKDRAAGAVEDDAVDAVQTELDLWVMGGERRVGRIRATV